MQHLAPLLVERVNAHYGWRCVGRIVLKQGPVPRPKAGRAPPAELSPEDRARIAAQTKGVEEDTLREALDRLGSAVVGSTGSSRTKA
jgi:hypothetical protein